MKILVLVTLKVKYLLSKKPSKLERKKPMIVAVKSSTLK
ncbi:hypothetical protein GM3709_2579 [Geminocystis sp. NIES-3709]|nr:hypothetical protein GM3709_2579 [Geminocystis sp. NIES-3709]